MRKIFCFGELLLRISPPLDASWIDNSQIPIFLGGAELNVTKALTKWGLDVRYCTALPSNSLAGQIKVHLTEKGIDTSAMQSSGDRIGIYYMVQGADLKSAGVIYDRSNSSFSCLQKGQLNWDELLKDVDWFHFSAITPALSDNVAQVCKEALEAAVRKNIKISVDLNYREKLWKYGKTPQQVMPELVQYCDVIMGNVWAADVMLGIATNDQLTSKDKKEYYLEQALQSSQEIQEKYPKCKMIANTYRFSNDKEQSITYYATLFSNNKLFHSATYYSDAVIDKSGSGDCFMAGLIYASHKELTSQETIDFATSAAFSKLFVSGDATNISVEEIKNWIKNG